MARAENDTLRARAKRQAMAWLMDDGIDTRPAKKPVKKPDFGFMDLFRPLGKDMTGKTVKRGIFKAIKMGIQLADYYSDRFGRWLRERLAGRRDDSEMPSIAALGGASEEFFREADDAAKARTRPEGPREPPRPEPAAAASRPGMPDPTVPAGRRLRQTGADPRHAGKPVSCAASAERGAAAARARMAQRAARQKGEGRAAAARGSER